MSSKLLVFTLFLSSSPNFLYMIVQQTNVGCSFWKFFNITYSNPMKVTVPWQRCDDAIDAARRQSKPLSSRSSIASLCPMSCVSCSTLSSGASSASVCRCRWISEEIKLIKVNQGIWTWSEGTGISTVVDVCVVLSKPADDDILIGFGSVFGCYDFVFILHGLDAFHVSCFHMSIFIAFSFFLYFSTKFTRYVFGVFMYPEVHISKSHIILFSLTFCQYRLQSQRDILKLHKKTLGK